MLRMNDHRVHESEKAGVFDQEKRHVSRVVNWGSIPLTQVAADRLHRADNIGEWQRYLDNHERDDRARIPRR
jgi:hypothetical protein